MSKDPFQTRSTAGSTDLSRQGSAQDAVFDPASFSITVAAA